MSVCYIKFLPETLPLRLMAHSSEKMMFCKDFHLEPIDESFFGKILCDDPCRAGSGFGPEKFIIYFIN